MKIQEYFVTSDYLEIIKAKQEAFKAASERLTLIEQAIMSGSKQVDMDYHNAFYDYMRADDEHMKTFLCFLKISYDNMVEKKKTIIFPESDKEKCDYLQKQVEESFNKYYEYYSQLNNITNRYKKEIDKFCSINLSKVPFTQIYLQTVLMGVDQQHASLANKVEQYRNDVLLPLIADCENMLDGNTNNESYEQNTFLS